MIPEWFVGLFLVLLDVDFYILLFNSLVNDTQPSGGNWLLQPGKTPLFRARRAPPGTLPPPQHFSQWECFTGCVSLWCLCHAVAHKLHEGRSLFSIVLVPDTCIHSCVTPSGFV